ncbi:MAG: hypothetical protein ACTHJ4_07110 [Candidatus Nucleicultricaceae bacterium]
MKKFFSGSSGITLIEVAIVLGILGILGGLSLPLLTKQMALKRHLQVKENQEKILTSLAVYLIQNGRLPCPAEDEDQGRAAKRCDQLNQAIGRVPFETLGLSKADVYDHQKKALMYAVDPTLTRTAQLHGNLSYCSAKGNFIRLFLDHDNVTELLQHDFVAVVVLSKGTIESLREQGHYLLSRGNLTLRLDNVHGAGQSQDRIAWASRHHLIAWYGKYPCPPALAVDYERTHY